MDDPLDELEQQLERSQLFTHSALAEVFRRAGNSTAALHALYRLLGTKGIIAPEEVADAVNEARQDLEAEGEISGPGTLIRVEPADATPGRVDCAARMSICHAVCCKLEFALTVEEVEQGGLRWDHGRPYMIRQGADGFCVHNDRGTGRCTVYDDRPGVCRRFSCESDARIWSDFENMVLNTEWLDANLQPGRVRLRGSLMRLEEPYARLPPPGVDSEAREDGESAIS